MTYEAEMIDHLVDPVIVIDKRGIILTANPSACSMFGWDYGELIHKPVTKLMPEPYRTEHDGYLQAYLETGETKAIGRVRKVTGQRKDGSEFPAELSVSFATHGDEPIFYGIVRDMTEREAMAARLSQVERLAAMGELAAGVAHEVNNPVNTIINCAQLVKDGDEDPTLLDDIIQEGMRIAMIVRDLLDFAADRTERFSEIDIGAIIDRVLNLVSRRLERQGIELASDVDAGLAPVSGLAHQIQQVVLNLVLNARDALGEVERERRRIEVRATQDETHVRIHVRDNGPGIAFSNQERIFEPFFTKKKHSTGTGLGLAVSRGIVNDHDGTLTVKSTPGEFAEFEIALPIAE